MRPTKADIAIAREIARGTGSAPEEVARALTWGADEKDPFWFWRRPAGSPRAAEASR